MTIFDEPVVEPITRLREWWAAAAAAEVRDPAVLALATVDAQGRSSSRMVATLRITDAGLVFASHVNSRKGTDLARQEWASGVLYWRELGQQVTVAGPVRPLPDTGSDELWAARPLVVQAMSVAAHQGEVLLDEEALRKEAQRLVDIGQPLPRPSGWVGYQMTFFEIEFWQSAADRLHQRLSYRREGAGWTCQRLQP